MANVKLWVDFLLVLIILRILHVHGLFWFELQLKLRIHGDTSKMCHDF